jgi:DNA invertase Pin-like site-specific DNA recombinase
MINSNGINRQGVVNTKKHVNDPLYKVALYCRVSTLEQHPENQEIELKDYANRNNFEIYNIYTDKISGAKDSRPALNDLMTDARKKLFKAVLIWKVDRLGRSVAHMTQVIQEWQNLGIDLIITTLAIDTRTPTGKLILGIFSQISEFERELIRERINLGLERRKKELKEKGYFEKEGKKITKLGRPTGARDKNPKGRRKSGYYRRWEKQNKKTTLGNVEKSFRRKNQNDRGENGK